ncbi:hypothetical protein ASD79_04815 [Caulobacter sp. Root655]|uniref:hypothetical protein n=1 Tax=Caulobacter sp. Root655 TaxID=1736578 RepID=UPI0006F417DD|nr:hypothetical protein [Caulobacter sp. Root655]KRA61449.1 hypothetical protein ASD79_04815 [Caulobacter sp. Root655]
MSRQVDSWIEGDFNGYDYGAIFRLDNGLVLQQASAAYVYVYAYRPRATVYWNGQQLMLQVQGMPSGVPIIQVDTLDEGVIVSDFKGFQGQSLFQFQNGHVWQQAEYKYSYQYAYRPEAIVIDGVDGPQLQVEGMDEPVRVRRVR